MWGACIFSFILAFFVEMGGIMATKKKSNVHAGHRLRLKARFHKEGLEHFEDHNVLELMLFYTVPVKDVNETAHELLKRFGSFSAVLDAPAEELKKVPLITDHTVTFFKLLPQVYQRYADDKASAKNMITDTKSAGAFIVPKFIGKKSECVILLCLDSKNKVLHSSTIFEGSINSTQISMRMITEQLLRYNATAAIIAHNHPGGIALPSRDDIETTKKIKTALALVNIDLLDHIIVSDDDFVSLADSGIFLENK